MRARTAFPPGGDNEAGGGEIDAGSAAALAPAALDPAFPIGEVDWTIGRCVSTKSCEKSFYSTRCTLGL
jgi:hypothetical protein